MEQWNGTWNGIWNGTWNGILTCRYGRPWLAVKRGMEWIIEYATNLTPKMYEHSVRYSCTRSIISTQPHNVL